MKQGTIIKINGVEVPFNRYDSNNIRTVAKYSKIYEDIARKLPNVKETIEIAELFEKANRAIIGMFNGLKKGAAKELGLTTNKFDLCVDTLVEFQSKVAELYNEPNDFESRLIKLNEKYLVDESEEVKTSKKQPAKKATKK